MMVGAYNFYDFYYRNSKGKIVCIKYDFKKRVKTKLNFILRKNKKLNNEVFNFLNENNLLLVKTNVDTKKYKRFKIIDKESE